jgi:hypothetical protein
MTTGNSSSFPKPPELLRFLRAVSKDGMMRYFSRATTHRNARALAGSAIDAAQGHIRLQRCRALLRELDPDKAPVSAQAREFKWQYRALRERVHLYSERLAAIDQGRHVPDSALRKAEMALDLSLRYFCDVLTPKHQLEAEESSDSDA